MKGILFGLGTWLIVVAPGVEAGSADHPEIRDGMGDVKTYGDVPLESGTTHSKAADIRAVWFSRLDADFLRIQVRVEDLSLADPASPQARVGLAELSFHVSFASPASCIAFAEFSLGRWTFLLAKDNVTERVSGTVNLGQEEIAIVFPSGGFGPPGLGLNFSHLSAGSRVLTVANFQDRASAPADVAYLEVPSAAVSEVPPTVTEPAKVPGLQAPVALLVLAVLLGRRIGSGVSRP